MAICQEPGAGEIVLSADFSNSFELNRDLLGVNSAIPTKPFQYSHPSFIEKYVELGKPLIRFPGGTYANYYDFVTGYFIPYEGISDANQTRIDGWNSNVDAQKKDVGGYSYTDFCNFANRTGAEYTLVLNITGKTADDTKRWMQGIKEQCQQVKYVEIGNELYFSNYDPVYPDVTSYINSARAHAVAVRMVFPDAKIGVIIPSHIYTHESFLDDLEEGESTKQLNWMEQLPHENFYDAVIIHLYSSLGMNNIESTSEFIPYLDAYYNCLSHADNKLEDVFSAITRIYPGKEIWVTEYHVGGFSTLMRQYRLRYSYLGGLFTANFMLKLFNEPWVTVGNWHSMAQFFTLPPESSYSTPLIPDDREFGTMVNYQFVKMFAEAVELSKTFVPLTVLGLENYEAVGEFAGSYADVNSGLFYANGGGFLMVINKSDRTYTMGSGVNVIKDSISSQLIILDQTLLERDPQLAETEGLESETDFKITTLIVADTVTIPPYSLSLLKCQENQK